MLDTKLLEGGNEFLFIFVSLKGSFAYVLRNINTQ